MNKSPVFWSCTTSIVWLTDGWSSTLSTRQLTCVWGCVLVIQVVLSLVYRKYGLVRLHLLLWLSSLLIHIHLLLCCGSISSSVLVLFLAVAYSLSELLVLHANWSACKTITEHLWSCSRKGWRCWARWIVLTMIWNLDTLSGITVGQIISTVWEHVDVSTAKKTSYLFIVVFLLEEVTFFGWFVVQI